MRDQMPSSNVYLWWRVAPIPLFKHSSPKNLTDVSIHAAIQPQFAHMTNQLRSYIDTNMDILPYSDTGLL